MNTNDLSKKITFCRKTTNDILTDKPIYQSLFSTFAKIVFASNGNFNSTRGSDINKITATVEIRNTTNTNNLSLDNLFVSYNSQYYKVNSCLYESENKGYLKFNIESVI